MPRIDTCPTFQNSWEFLLIRGGLPHGLLPLIIHPGRRETLETRWSLAGTCWNYWEMKPCTLDTTKHPKSAQETSSPQSFLGSPHIKYIYKRNALIFERKLYDVLWFLECCSIDRTITHQEFACQMCFWLSFFSIPYLMSVNMLRPSQVRQRSSKLLVSPSRSESFEFSGTIFLKMYTTEMKSWI